MIALPTMPPTPPTYQNATRQAAPGVVRERQVQRAYDERGTLRGEALRETVTISGQSVPPTLRQLPSLAIPRTFGDRLGELVWWIVGLTVLPPLAVGGGYLCAQTFPSSPVAGALGYLAVLATAYFILT